MSACPKCGEPRPGGQRMHKCSTTAHETSIDLDEVQVRAMNETFHKSLSPTPKRERELFKVETEENDPLVGGSEGFGMWDGPYETIEKLTAERDALRGELQAIMDAAKACYDKDNDEFMRMPPGNPGNCWEAPSRHLQTFAWIRDTAQRALAATENKKNE